MDFEELLHRYRSTSTSVTKNQKEENGGDDVSVSGGGEDGFEFPVMKTPADEKEDDDKTVKSKKISATLLAKLLLERQNKNRLEKQSMKVEKPRRLVGSGVEEGKKDLTMEIEKNNRLLDSILKGGSPFVGVVETTSSVSNHYPKNLFIENEEVEPISITNNGNENNVNNHYQPTPVMTIEEMLANPEYPLPLSDSVTISEIRARVREEENQKYLSRREIEEKVKRCCEISEDIHLTVKNMQEHVYRLDIHFRFLRQIMAIDDSEIEEYIKEISLYPSGSTQEEEEDNHIEKLSSFKFASTSSAEPKLPLPKAEEVEEVEEVEDVEDTIPVYEMEDDLVEEGVSVDRLDVVDVIDVGDVDDNNGEIIDVEENQEDNTKENGDLPTSSNVSIFAPLRPQVRSNGIFGNNSMTNMKKFQTIH